MVTITGINLSNQTAINIGGVAALPISNKGTQLVAMVMPGASISPVNIATPSTPNPQTGAPTGEFCVGKGLEL